MKNYLIFLIIIILTVTIVFLEGLDNSAAFFDGIVIEYPQPIDFEFVGLNDSYQLGEKFTIKFEKTTQQPCPSYEISIMKDGLPESKISHKVEPLCAVPGPVEPYLFSEVYSKPEFFDTVGIYRIEVKIDGDTIFKKIEIVDKTFSITQKQVRYVVPYEITSGTINDMKLNCDSGSLLLSISSDASGTLHLDIPEAMLGAIFMVSVNDEEWDDVSLDGNVITVNFPGNTNKIEIRSAFHLNSNKTGVCDVVHDPPYSYVLSPLKQYDAGVRYYDIVCKDGLELVGKLPYGIPACVKPQSVEKLVQRWWATTDRTYDLVNPQTYSVTKNEKTFQIQYSLEGAKLSEIVRDEDANSIHVILNDADGGALVISILRDLMDAKIGNEDDDFFVLINGLEINFGEKSNETERTLTILFPKDARDIEIIATVAI